ncbi:hypothetical protein D9M71_667300 [compost metagenome]
MPGFALTIQRPGNRQRIGVQLNDCIDPGSVFIESVDALQQMLYQRLGAQLAALHFLADFIDTQVLQCLPIGAACDRQQNNLGQPRHAAFHLYIHVNDILMVASE